MTLRPYISAIYFSSNPIDLNVENESWCKNATYCTSYENIAVEETKAYNFTLSFCMDYLYITIRSSPNNSNEERTVDINIAPSNSTPYLD